MSWFRRKVPERTICGYAVLDDIYRIPLTKLEFELGGLYYTGYLDQSTDGFTWSRIRIFGVDLSEVVTNEQSVNLVEAGKGIAIYGRIELNVI